MQGRNPFQPTPAELLRRAQAAQSKVVAQPKMAAPPRRVLLSVASPRPIANPRPVPTPASRFRPVPAIQRAVAPRMRVVAPSPLFRVRPVVPVPRHGTIQAKVQWDGQQAKFWGDGERPKWRKHLKEHTTEHYNTHHGTSHPTNVNFTTLNSDRTHKYPFTKIETVIVDFCNQDTDRNALIDIAKSLVPEDSPRYNAMSKVLNQLIAAVPGSAVATIKKLANSLLGELNSANENVLSGSDSDNRGIGDKWDLNYEFTPNKTHYVPTPKGKHIYETTTKYGYGTDLPKTPTGQHYRTSQYGSEKPLVKSTIFPTVTTTTTKVSNNNNTGGSQSVPQSQTQTNTVSTQQQTVLPPLNTLLSSVPSQISTQSTQTNQQQGFSWNQSTSNNSYQQPQQQFFNPPVYTSVNPPPSTYFYPLGFYYVDYQQNYYTYYPPGWY